MKPQHVLILFSLISYFFTFSQKDKEGFQLFENAKFENFTIENGLPSDFCVKVVETSDNTIWVASMHGLVNYNGFKWEYYKQECTSKSKRIGSNWVMDLYPTTNKIWYHTDKDVGYIDLNTHATTQITTVKNGWGKVIADKNNLFVSTWEGVINYQKNKWMKVSDNFFDECKEFIKIKDEVISINTYNKGFYSYNKQKKRFIHHAFVYNSHHLKRAFKITHAVAFKNQILALTEKNGVILINPKTLKYTTVLRASLLNNLNPTCLLPYRFNKQKFIVFGTNDRGIVCIDLKNFNQINCIPIPEIKDQTIASKKIHHLFRDSKNGIWISTDKGISYFSPENQTTRATYFYQNKVIPEDAIITALRQINKDEILIGTKQNGLFLYNSTSLKTKKIALHDKTAINNISSLIHGFYYIATASSIYYLDLKLNQVKHLNLPIKNCLKIRILNAENIGFSSDYGILIYSIKTHKIIFKEIVKKDEFNNSNHNTLDFIKDSFENIWLLRKYNGLYHYNMKNDRYTKTTPSSYFKNGIDFHSMSFDKKSNKIVVASSSGIFIHSIYHPKKVVVLNSKNGLEGDYINFAVLKNKNEIYYSTINGVFSYQLNSSKSKLLFSFGQYEQKENPLFELNKNGVTLPISNYYIHYFDHSSFNSSIKQPQLNSIIIGGKFIAIDKQVIHLNYSNRHLELLFNAYNYLKNSKMTLEYQLNPINNHWTEINNGSLEFIGLEPSNYQLKIRWRDLTSNKTSKILEKKITINMPFYLNWLFYLLISITVGMVLFIIYHLRIKSKEQLLATRLQISRDLHDELGANVSSINILTHLISNVLSKESTTQKYLQQLKENSSKITETINDIIWNVNPRFDKLNDIVMKVKRYASPIFENAHIHVNYDIQLNDENSIIDQHIKYNLYLIIKESINNCAKYSTASSVLIKIHATSKSIYYEIKDDGVGFDLERKKEKGNGLLNMQTRAAAIRGILSIDTSPNKGTKINLTI
jgi:ligand-binding sensor domain-containing protein